MKHHSKQVTAQNYRTIYGTDFFFNLLVKLHFKYQLNLDVTRKIPTLKIAFCREGCHFHQCMLINFSAVTLFEKVS